MTPQSQMGESVPDDPTVAQIADMLAGSYTQEGVVRFLNGPHRALHQARPIDLMITAEGRREIYGLALALAEGVFS